LSPPTTSEAIRQASQQARRGEVKQALALTRSALRAAGQAPPEVVQRAGKLLQRLFAADPGAPGLRVLLLAQCTSGWVSQALAAVAWREGVGLHLTEGGYDTVLQDLLAAPDRGYDAVVLLPWHQRLLDAEGSVEERVASELGFWEGAWRLVAERSARLVQVGYDWTQAGPLGHQVGARAEGPVAAVRRLNTALRERLPSGAYLVDLEQVSGVMGREGFYDPRREHWTRQPFSEAGASWLAEHLWAGLRAVTSGPKKALVLDLDDTLWGGVVGEEGPLEIELGDTPEGAAFRAFQRHLKGLRERGVLLAVCSKNNPGDAREPFLRNPEMVLSLEDFAAFEASWDPKPAGLSRIAATLNLDPASFVFFDDNPAERELMRQALPQVTVIDVPPEPAEYVRALEAGLWFEAVAVDAADRMRADQYLDEELRQRSQEGFTSLDDYLRSLDMRAEVRSIGEADLARVVQLLGKTNQFNLTTRRHGREHVQSLLAEEGALGLTLRLRDRFGDYGLISVVLGQVSEQAGQRALRLDTWLMSCRAIGRTVEDFLLSRVAEEAARLGYVGLVGEMIPSPKNAQVADLYPRLGFEPLPSAGEVRRFWVRLDQLPRARHFLTAV
jgi:FkbH-like protein